jgi:glycosyltransferase involved in cell wall biosynthesis
MPTFDIMHVSSVHSRIDTRIRYKQCVELARAYPGQVAYVVQDGKGDETNAGSGLSILDVGEKPKLRAFRALLGNWRMVRAVGKHQAKIVHFHDPELIITGLISKMLGRRVIYDIHEDVPNQLLAKSYIKSRFVRRIVSKIMEFIEAFAVGVFDKSVPSVHSIAQRFPVAKTCVVRNFPRAELTKGDANITDASQRFIINYAGSLTKIRGILDLVEAMHELPAHFELHLLGNWSTAEFERECASHPGWAKCHYYGRVPHDEVGKFMAQAHLGVQMTHDIPNHTGGLATKVFEYLFLSVPVLMSDTSEKRTIYGTLADYALPNNPKAIAVAIKSVADDYDNKKVLAVVNRKIALESYSWEGEAKKLLSVYDECLAL